MIGKSDVRNGDLYEALFFGNEIDWKPNNYKVKIVVAFVGKEFIFEDEKENLNVKDHCHLTGNFRGLAHDKCNLATRKNSVPFVRIIFHNSFGYDCHVLFEKIISLAIQKGIIIKWDGFTAKSWENNIYVKIGCLSFWI